MVVVFCNCGVSQESVLCNIVIIIFLNDDLLRISDDKNLIKINFSATPRVASAKLVCGGTLLDCSFAVWGCRLILNLNMLLRLANLQLKIWNISNCCWLRLLIISRISHQFSEFRIALSWTDTEQIWNWMEIVNK